MGQITNVVLLLHIALRCSAVMMSEEEASQELLSVFHISRPHDKAANHVTPPEYMMNLWHKVADEHGYTKAPAPYHSNTVRAVPDKAGSFQERYWFNVSNVAADEELMGAELHLYKMKRPPVTHYHLWETRVWQIRSPGGYGRHAQRVLLDTRRVSAYYHGWLVFQIRSAVQDWVRDPTSNYGLLVTVSREGAREDRSDLAVFAQRGQHHDSKQPIIAVFSTDRTIEPSSSAPHLTRHEIKMNMNVSARLAFTPRQTQRYLNEDDDLLITEEQLQSEPEVRSKRVRRRAGSKRDRKKRRRKSCSRHSLKVDFTSIGWDDFIISPQWFQAYQCVGVCAFPLGTADKPTNHANVQSIVHVMKSARNSRNPCCVPTKLESIALLYFGDDDHSVLLRQYTDMVAVECGCR